MLEADFLLKLVPVIVKPFVDHSIGYFYSESNKRQLENICKDELKSINDCSSLDSDEFNKFVSSTAFQKLLQSYYMCLPIPGKKSDTFLNHTTNLCKSKVPTVNENEFRRFLKSIDQIMQKNRSNILNRDSKLHCIMSLISQSNNLICDQLINKFDEIKSIFERRLNEANKTNYDNSNRAIIDEHHRICFLEYNTIKFTGIEGAENKKDYTLKDLYVPNDFYLDISNKFIKDNKVVDFDIDQIKQSKIPLNGILDIADRLVVIGGAGYGKSTFLEYIICYFDEIYGSKDILRVKLNLKDVAKKIDNQADIEKCIFDEIRKRTNKKYDDSSIDNIITEYLCNGKCLIFFDALDEIDVLSKRIDMIGYVSIFCNKYIHNKFIITSREVGYLKNQFDNTFLHIRISPFNENQIKDYSMKWLSFQRNSNENEIEEYFNGFMGEVKKAHCQELINNPIMLILSLIVFRVENKLPHAKIDFYKKCIKTFLSEREESKGAFDMQPIADIYSNELVLPAIAYFKLENEKENPDYKFSQEDIKELTFKAIELTDKEKVKWMHRVKEYVKYLIERTELIKVTDEDDRHDFSHKSFRDYFLAVYYSKCLQNSELITFIKSEIGDANNHELVVLIIQYVVKESIKAHRDKTLDFLFADIEDTFSYFEMEQKCVNSASYYLRIIEDLFLDSALPPKYHDRFISIYLKYSFAVNMHVRPMDEILNHDNYRELFREKFKEIELSYKFEAILNYEFVSDICGEVQNREDEIGVFSNLIFHGIVCNKKSWAQNDDSIYNYIKSAIGKYKDVIAECDAMYLAIILASQMLEDKGKYTRIIDEMIQINSNSVESVKYISLEVFKRLVPKMTESPLDYAILLKVIPKTLQGLERLINSQEHRNCGLMGHPSKELVAKKNEQLLNHSINCRRLTISRIIDSDSYDTFIKKLQIQKLYDQKYTIIYKDAFEICEMACNSIGS